jgi:hypothetical protein
LSIQEAHDAAALTGTVTPTVSAPGDVAAAGVSLVPAAADHLHGRELGWQTYFPTWTVPGGSNPTIGNGTVLGRYFQTGKLVAFRILIECGTTTTAGSGSRYQFSLPVACPSTSLQSVTCMVTASGAGTPAIALLGVDVQTNWGCSTTGCSVLLPAGGGVYGPANLSPVNPSVFLIEGTYESV